MQERLTKEHDDYKQEKALLAKTLRYQFLYNETQEQVANLTKYAETDLSILVKITEDLSNDLSSMQTNYKIWKRVIKIWVSLLIQFKSMKSI